MKSLLLALLLFCASTSAHAAGKPNLVVIFCDDLGYGDLACFGSPTIKTPNLDRMATEGQKWTNFYVAAPVCTPSRAGLLTGRLPIRNGMCSSKRRVLFPDSAGGLPSSEMTISSALKGAGYNTAAVGKWHLGHLPQFLPTSHGFDSYFGVPYSNDMDRVASKAPRGREAFWTPKSEYWNVPLLRGEKEIERSPDQTQLTKRYTEEAVGFIRKQVAGTPFFLYLAHSMPHVPLFASEKFSGKSSAGLYGDVIEEIDWSVGQVLDTLREKGLAGQTLVVFTSDNGPWLVFDTHGGNAGTLRAGKGSTWEGGMREPTIFWWPGKVPHGVVHEIGSTLDLLPTACALAGVEMPGDRSFDGEDLSPALFGAGGSPRDEMFFYHGEELYAVRKGAHKLHFTTKVEYVGQKPERHDPPLLFHLGHDPGENFDIAADHPELVKQLVSLAEEHRAGVVPVESQLTKRIRN
ncbi:MAG: sulfatase family protein [Verrucomicrobiales bacterium]